MSVLRRDFYSQVGGLQPPTVIGSAMLFTNLVTMRVWLTKRIIQITIVTCDQA